MTLFPWLDRGLSTLRIAVLLGGSVFRLFAQTNPAEPVVELPQFNVTEGQLLPEPESWRYASIPGFEILTNASDKRTQRLITELERFQQALSIAWPAMSQSARPAALILCGKKSKFDDFVPDGRVGPEIAKASLFLKDREQTTLVINLQASVVGVASSEVDSPDSGYDSSEVAVDHDKQLYREYVRFLLSQSETKLPPWFEEGLAQIVMAMKFDRKLIEFGKLEDPNTISAQAAAVGRMNALLAADGDGGGLLPGAPVEDRDFNRALFRRALIPLDKFFAVTGDSPEANNPLGNNRWAKQAYAFVHLCLYGQRQRYTKGFVQFLMRASKEPVNEAMFKECFGASYNDMLIALRSYVEAPDYKSQEFRIKGEGLPLPPALVLREATSAEVGRIKGTALIAAGHSERARLELIAPYVRGERDARLLAELGLFERAAGRDERARHFLEAAFAGKAARPRAELELARLRLQAIDAAAGATPAPLSVPQRQAVLAPLLAATREPPPRLPEIYEMLASTWRRSAAGPTREDLAPLLQGTQFFPQRLGLIYQTATLCIDAGVTDAATSLIEYGIKVSPNAASRTRFEQLQASLAPPK